jgi:hypothetical protein
MFLTTMNACVQAFHTGFNAYMWNGQKFVEEVPLPKTQASVNIFEMRLNGPRCKPISAGSTKFYLDVNILCTCVYDEKNPLFIRNMICQAIDFLINTAFIVPDIGCMQLNNDEVKGNYFGFVDPTIQISQGTAEGHYYLAYDSGTQP